MRVLICILFSLAINCFSQDILKVPYYYNAESVGNFDGVDDYIDCTDQDTFSFGNGTTDEAFSLSAWVTVNEGNTFFITKSDGGVSKEYIFYINLSGYLEFVVYKIGAGVNALQVIERSSNLIGNTYFFTATYDGSGAKEGIELYINGVEQTEETRNEVGTYTAMSNGTHPVFINRFTNNYAYSKIWDVAIYNKELTPSEILNIYNTRLFNDNIIGLWTFIEGDGATIYDASGNGNNGAATNTTLVYFWAKKTNQNRYGQNYGYTINAGVNIPALLDGSTDAQGNPIGVIAPSKNPKVLKQDTVILKYE